MRYPAVENTIDPVIRLYTGLLDRKPDKAGVEYWVSQLNADKDLRDLALGFTASNEFMQLTNQLGGELRAVLRRFITVSLIAARIQQGGHTG